MKPSKILALLVTTVIASGSALAAGGGGKGPGGPSWSPARNSAAVAPLNAEEARLLLWLREEEKLARDVYLGLFERWQSQEFANIARSEQRHFDAIGAKLALFGLADPALPTVGQFADPALQELYHSLLTTGNVSYADALRVGATIEDLDIGDLLAAIEASEHATVTQTYTSLLEGSKNHLRAFVGRLAALGIEYEPQYIEPAFFDAIIGR